MQAMTRCVFIRMLANVCCHCLGAKPRPIAWCFEGLSWLCVCTLPWYLRCPQPPLLFLFDCVYPSVGTHALLNMGVCVFVGFAGLLCAVGIRGSEHRVMGN